MTGPLTRSLEGVRVVALATNIPAPLAAARLCALGASVVKIEPQHGDPLAAVAPAWYRELVRDLEVIRADLRTPRGRALLDECLRDADVLITSMRASALERIGLDWATLHAARPGAIHAAIFGEAPPHDDRAGHDLTYQARAGLLAPPAMPRTVIGDLAAAERACSAVLAALLQRARTGEGVRVDVAIVDAAIEFAAPLRYGLTGPHGVLGGALDAYALYRARDGWIAVAALEEHFASRLRSMLAVERLDADSLRTAFESRSAREWEELAQAHDLPLAAVAPAEVPA